MYVGQSVRFLIRWIRDFLYIECLGIGKFHALKHSARAHDDIQSIMESAVKILIAPFGKAGKKIIIFKAYRTLSTIVILSNIIKKNFPDFLLSSFLVQILCIALSQYGRIHSVKFGEHNCYFKSGS